MQVSKWGNSLAIRIPASVVEALGLKEGDNVEIFVEGEKSLSVPQVGGSPRALRAREETARQAAQGVPVRSPQGQRAPKGRLAERPFLDTNVLLLSAIGRPVQGGPGGGTPAARGIVSVQVLNELANVAVRKLGLTWRQLSDLIAAVRASCRVEALTEEVHDQARSWPSATGLSFYDACIVSSALDAGCGVLYSEDFQHGFKIDRTSRSGTLRPVGGPALPPCDRGRRPR